MIMPACYRTEYGLPSSDVRRTSSDALRDRRAWAPDLTYRTGPICCLVLDSGLPGGHERRHLGSQRSG